jgi:toxin YoeB
MVKWKIAYTRQAQRDVRKLAAAGPNEKTERLIKMLSEDLFKSRPPYERLLGDLSGAYSRRINIKHRLVYQVLENIKTVKIIRMWRHYEYGDQDALK